MLKKKKRASPRDNIKLGKKKKHAHDVSAPVVSRPKIFLTPFIIMFGRALVLLLLRKGIL